MRICCWTCFDHSPAPDNTGAALACLLSVCVSSLHKVCVCVRVRRAFVMVVIPVTQAPCASSLGTGQTFSHVVCLLCVCLCAGVSHRCAEAETGVAAGEQCLCVCVCLCVCSDWKCMTLRARTG